MLYPTMIKQKSDGKDSKLIRLKNREKHEGWLHVDKTRTLRL